MNPAKILIGICLLVVSQFAFGQHIYKIKTDSLLVTNDSCNAELNLENSTRNINGFLYNKGNGRTEFRRGLIKLTDSTYQIGNDILNLGSYSSNNSWKTTGNNNITTNNFLGTLDSSKLIFKTNGVQHASIGVDGTINFEVNDTASKPAFRFYPNGDFVVKARRELAGNTFGPNSGIRYNAKYGILEVGTNNNFDTTRSTVCCGSLSKSAIIINSDFMNTITGDVHGSLVAGDNHVITSAAWSSVFGERHRMSGAGFVNKSMISGYGHAISAEINTSIITGDANQISHFCEESMVSGIVNSDLDTTYATFVNGGLNQYSGSFQLISGINLRSRNWGATTLGSANVDFSSLPAINKVRPADLKNYPILAIGNSNSYNTVRSNALTMLYNGRTQINTTGCDVSLSQTDVTPKAALEIVSNNSGILIPRLTTAQISAITSSDLRDGLLLYNTDSSAFQYYNGSVWQIIIHNTSSPATQFWSFNGNAGTNPSNNFLGTTDANRLVFKTANTERATIDTLGNLGISTNFPQYKIDVNGTARISNIPFIANRDTVVTYDTATKQLKSTKIINSANEGNVVGRISAGSGSLELLTVPVVLATGSISNAPNLSIDLSPWYTKYDEIEIKLINIRPTTSNVELRMRLSADGSNYDAGTGAYKWGYTYVGASLGGGSANNASETFIKIGLSFGNATAMSGNVRTTISNPSSSTFYPLITGDVVRINYDGDLFKASFGGTRTNAQATRGAQFYFSSGNISTASYKIIGIKN